MQDDPAPAEILAAVARFLRDTVVPEATPHTGFRARVAASALDLVTRQIALAPASDAAEQARLMALLGSDRTLAALNQLLAERVAAGEIDVATPGLAGHLLATTLAKLAVDQPTYSGYRAALEQDR